MSYAIKGQNKTTKLPKRKVVMKIVIPSIVENDIIVQKETIVHLSCPYCNFDISEQEVNSKHCNECNSNFDDPAKFLQVFRGK